MKLPPMQQEILRAAAAFATVERYQGALPRRQALLYSKKDLAALEEAGLLERIKLSYPCGRTMAGWRLTEAGRLELPQAETPEEPELMPEHLRILNDVYHYSRLSTFRGMMPGDVARRQCDKDDLEDLFNHGYLLRIRVKNDGKAKGWVVSNKGLAALRRRQEQDGTPAAPA
ncbi:hypothetical protein [Solidesulfovibrio sp.]|uniref:hypothetical protein n=1 Tax=Solidesulfovibrio sp. TaxID=2910990 RepID=UPI00260D949E|nr:hypothetical protein [Solidesulfovibrio sp.]